MKLAKARTFIRPSSLKITTNINALPYLGGDNPNLVSQPPIYNLRDQGSLTDSGRDDDSVRNASRCVFGCRRECVFSSSSLICLVRMVSNKALSLSKSGFSYLFFHPADRLLTITPKLRIVLW